MNAHTLKAAAAGYDAKSSAVARLVAAIAWWGTVSAKPVPGTWADGANCL